MSTHLIAKVPTPVLNTPDFANNFGAKNLPLDEKGLFRPLELIALPGTHFSLKKQISPYIAEVTTEEYPCSPLYIDLRFTTPCSSSSPRKKALPPPARILERLEKSLGLPYIWGGNWGQGIPELQTLYKASTTFQGVDCSGLLYEATDGFTPRNTSELLQFGEEVTSRENIRPLDLIIWPGHVVIAFDSATTIESLHPQGVIIQPLSKALPQNNISIRRFI